jgi:hypothetical protein
MAPPELDAEVAPGPALLELEPPALEVLELELQAAMTDAAASAARARAVGLPSLATADLLYRFICVTF